MQPISWKPTSHKPRIAFGLGNLPHTPPEKRRRQKHCPINLPSIAEDEEEYVQSEDENPQEEEKLIDQIQAPPKPPRTFEHVFPTDRILVVVDSRTVADIEEPKSKFQSITSLVKISLEEKVSKAQSFFLKYFYNIWKQLTTSAVIPCAFLVFVTHNALLTFVALTPVMLNEYIDGKACHKMRNWLKFSDRWDKSGRRVLRQRYGLDVAVFRSVLPLFLNYSFFQSSAYLRGCVMHIVPDAIL